METTLVDRLKESLQNFKRSEAIELSDSIHEMEKEGQDLSPREERLWLKLTEEIERTRE